MSRTVVFLLCGWLLAACVEDGTVEENPNTVENSTVTPQPLPIPDKLIPPTAHLIYLSAPTNETTVVAGVAPAVATGTGVGIRNGDRDESFEGPLCLNKGFLLDVKWALGESLECWANDPDGSSKVVPLMTPSSLSVEIPEVDEPSYAGGKTIVSGKVGSNQLVIVGNRSTGCVTRVDASTDGSFESTLGASAGDRLVLFSLDPQTREPSPVVEATVPP